MKHVHAGGAVHISSVSEMSAVESCKQHTAWDAAWAHGAEIKGSLSFMAAITTHHGCVWSLQAGWQSQLVLASLVASTNELVYCGGDHALQSG